MAHIVVLDNPDDPRVDDFRDLANVDRRPDRAGGPGLVVGEGVWVVQRMLASRFTPFALLGVGKKLADVQPYLTDQVCYQVTAEAMAKIVGFHLNRGILAVARRPEPLTVEQAIAGADTIAVLEGVNDHENIGSIFRNGAGLDAGAVLIGDRCSDPLYRRSVRVSMGHVLRVPFATVPAWPSGLDMLRANGFQIVGLTPAPNAVPLPQAVEAAKIAFLLGAEGPGLTEDAIRACDVTARIPMSRETDSLNVATAAAIAFYERHRARMEP